MEKIVKMALMMVARMQLAQRVRRISGAAKWAALAAICGVGALMALVVALWVFLVARIGPEAAALSMAGVLALMCVVFALAARATLHSGRGRNINPEDRTVAELKEMFAKNKGTALLSAVLAGIAMGNGRK